MKSKELKYVFLTVTPEMAKKWLESNFERNRIIDKHRIEFLADQMRRGMWRTTGNAIQFDTEGKLQDGQHRLLACVAAGVPFKTLVVYNVPPESYIVQNCSKPQRSRDILRYNNIPNATSVAAIIHAYFSLRKGYSDHHAGQSITKTSNEDILIFYRNHSGIIDIVVRQCSVFYDRTRVFSMKETGGLILYAHLVKKWPLEQVVHFFDKCSNFRDFSNPTCVNLREYLRKLYEKSDKYKLNSGEKFKILGFALNRYLSNKGVFSVRSYASTQVNSGFELKDLKENPYAIFDNKDNE